jgi:hypothetical protein
MKKMDKIDRPDADKSEGIKLEFLMELLTIFCPRMDANSRGVDKWVIAFCKIEYLKPLKEPDDKTRMFRTLLKGQALSYFGHHLRTRLEAEDSELPDSELIEQVLIELYIELGYIPKHAIHAQKVLYEAATKGFTYGS